MKIEKFEDIKSWQKAKDLTKKIYCIKCKTDIGHDLSFMDQMRRSSISIMANIAEGFERSSNREFIRFLFISKASAGELRSFLHIGRELNYISKTEYDVLLNDVLEISKMISGFIKYLREDK